MKWFCKHNWAKIKETNTQPIPNRRFECSEWLAERLICGVTTVLFQCSKCKKIRKEEMLGI